MNHDLQNVMDWDSSTAEAMKEGEKPVEEAAAAFSLSSLLALQPWQSTEVSQKVYQSTPESAGNTPSALVLATRLCLSPPLEGRTRFLSCSTAGRPGARAGGAT